MRHYLKRLRNKCRDGPQVQMSLRILLIAPLVAQVLIAVGLAGWLAHRNGQRAVEQLAYQLLNDSGEHFHSQLEAHAAVSAIVTQANIDALELGQLDGTDMQSWSSHLARQSDRFPDLNYIYYGSSDGQYVGLHKLPSGRLELAIKSTPSEKYLSIYGLTPEGNLGTLLRTSLYEYYPRQRPWYKAAETSSQPLWTNVYEFAGEHPHLGISFVQPHRAPDQSLKGVLGADFTILAIDQFLADLKLTPGSETLLIQPDGTIVASSESSFQAGAFALSEQSLGQSLGQRAIRQLLSRADAAPTDREQQFRFRSNGVTYWVQATPFSDGYGLDWLGISVLPETDFTRELASNRRNTALLCLLALMASTAASVLLAQRLSQPILRLGLASQAIARGDPHTSIAPSPIREVNLLVQSFNRMSQDLAQSRSQLNAYSQQLETLVEERTRDLRQSEENFAIAFEASPNGVAFTGFDNGQFIDVNERFAELLELSKDAILGRTSTDLDLWVAPYTRADYRHQLTTDGIRNQEWQVRTASGIKTVLLSSEIIDVQGESRILSIINDISARKRAQDALKVSQAKFQRLVDDIGDAFVVFSHTGVDGVITYVSSGFSAVFGLAQEAILNASWAESIHWLPEDMRRAQTAVVEAVEQAVEFQQFEMRFVHPSGQQRTVLVSQHPVRDDTGTLIAIDGILENITARKLTEAKLRQSEAQLAEAQRIAHVGNWEIDLKTKQTIWSPELLRIFGFDPKGPPPTYIEAFRRLHSDDRQRWSSLFRRLLTTGAAYDVDLRVALPDGSLRQVEGRGEGIRNAQGKIVRVRGTGLDVTARKRAQKELAQQIQRQLLLTSITNQIRQSLDIQDVYQTTAQEVGQAFGVSRCLLHTYADPSGATVLTVAQYLAAGCASMAQISLPMDNAYAHTILTSDCAIATHDVNQDPLLEPALDLCQQFQIKSILAICTSYQGQPNGLIGLHQCDRQRNWTKDEIELLGAVAAQVGIAIAQARLLQQEQQQREQLFNQNIALDRAIAAAEAASRAKSEFLANMSHELRTPLNAILGFSHLMTRDTNLTRKQATNLNIINRSGEHLLDLINSVLDMSKIESGHTALYPVDINLRRFLTEIVDMFALRAQEKGLDLILDLASDVPVLVYADSGKLRQVLVNLLSNALKSTASGTVTLRVRTGLPHSSDSVTSGGPSTAIQPKLDDEDHTLASQPSCLLTFDVEDTGYGINSGSMAQIFQPFVQSEVGINTRSGTGLGLTITQKFVALMGGQLTVTSGGMTYTTGQLHPQPLPSSRQTSGSCFHVTVCLALGRHTAPQSNQPKRRVIGLADGDHPPRILVVDDLWESRHLLQQILTPLGFDVRLAENGQTALEIWQAWRPDLIWMDMRMPTMDGYQVTRHIKDQPAGQETVIIALTASSLESDRAKVMSSGCDDYVRKPIHPDLILDKIAEHVDVHYRYEQTDRPDQDFSQSIQERTTSLENALHRMPSAWIRQLLQAAKGADNDRIAELISDHKTELQLSQTIQAIMDNFRYDILIQATQDLLSLPEDKKP